MKSTRFAVYAWGVLAYNLLVIVWGAFVRATGSGAGCGRHWPLCNGEIIPRAPRLETLIEFSHRISSGLALLSVILLLVWAWRTYPKAHRVRRAAIFVMALMITESLVGAGLVLFELVAYNVSIARAYWMAAHLTNTFFLLAAITLTAWWASGGAPVQLRGQGSLFVVLAIGIVGALILTTSGGITALGDTLYVHGGITPEQSSVVSTLVGLRVYHPMLAFVVGAILAAAAFLARARRPDVWTQRLSAIMIGLFVAQLLLGALNVALMAPVWIQLVHLLLSNLIWIALVLLAACALAQRDSQSVMSPHSASAVRLKQR